MAYGTTVLEIMVASPSDVTEEREAIIEVIQHWNYTNSRRRKIILLPRLWESSTAPVTGSRGQEVIIKQILEHCDILIAVFWSKVGSPTGDYPSGTIEEIKTHIDSGKPAMIYFSLRPLPDGHDPLQVQKVKEFKEECQKENGPYSSLYHEYTDIIIFKERLRDHIDIILDTNEYLETEIKQSLVNYFSETVSLSIPDSNGNEIELTGMSKELLTEACLDAYGTIYQRPFMGGLMVQTNRKQFAANNEPRKEAEIKQALSDLENEGLIEPESYERNSFKVTVKGYKYFDEKLKQTD